MAYILNQLSGKDVTVELASYLDQTLESTTTVSKVKDDIASGKLAAAVSHLVAESAKLWPSEKAADKDIEAFYAQITYFLITPEFKISDETRDAVIRVVSSENSRAPIRMSVLNYLFNAGQAGSWKIATLEAIIKLAISSNQKQVVESMLQDLDRLFQQWATSESDKASVHAMLHTLLADSDPWMAHVHQMKWLESFKTEAECEKVVEGLTKAIEGAIIRPSVFQFQSIVSSVAAKVVAKTHPELIQLATILSHGTYAEIVALGKSSKIFTSTPGLSLDATITKIRLLTLTSLAQDKTIIPYQTVATALDVPLEDTESWVLDAISEGLLDAKLDHLSSSVFVTFAFRREFSTAQWTDLHDKLGKWMDNIKGMLTVIRESRAEHGSVQQHLALKQGLLTSAQ